MKDDGPGPQGRRGTFTTRTTRNSYHKGDEGPNKRDLDHKDNQRPGPRGQPETGTMTTKDLDRVDEGPGPRGRRET